MKKEIINWYGSTVDSIRLLWLPILAIVLVLLVIILTLLFTIPQLEMICDC